jgi:two-component system sporulation sensor kinase B
MIKDMLLHTLTILFPIMLVQMLMLDKFDSRMTARHQALIGVISGISAMVCMTFPVHLDSSFIWDFRWIPLMLAMLYGGYLAGGIALLLSLLYRHFIGGDVASISMVGNLVFAIVPFIISLRFYQLNRLQRIFASMLTSFLSYVFVLALLCLYLYHIDNFAALFAFGPFYIAAGLIQLALTFVSVYIIEKASAVSKMKANMQVVEKLTIISELAASVTHEVRNPLTVVRGFIQLAQSNMDDNGRKYMKTAIEELDRAEFIISDYLSFAKPHSDRVEDIDVAPLIENLVLLMSSYATVRRVTLESSTEQGLVVHGDQVKLKQVVINLIKNAIEAIKGSGQIEVKAFGQDKYVMLQIKDNGEGMTNDQLKQLGKTYYSTKENGTGIGLMVAFQIISTLNGKLSFESGKGRGTTAVIKLPRVSA